jgi:hypothetical protein
MTFSDGELKLIEEYAALFLSYEEIAILINKEFGHFLSTVKSKTSPAYKAYMKGKLRTKIELRTKIVKMAMHGSPQAELMVNQYISDQEISELD